MSYGFVQALLNYQGNTHVCFGKYHSYIQQYTVHEKELTIYKELLLVGQDAGEVTALQTTLSFPGFPCPSVCEVFIAVALKLVPAKVTNLCI